MAAGRGARRGSGQPTPALVTGPLCLNVDVLHPAARSCPPVDPGDVLAGARGRRLPAGAGDAVRRPAPRGGRPRRRPLAGARRETRDLLAGDLDVALTTCTARAVRQLMSRGGSMSERLIVIGGGGAGIAARDDRQAARPRPAGRALHASSRTSPTRPCGIPFVHGGEIPEFEDLFLSTVQRYVDDGLDMRMETAVTEIDLDRAHGHRAQQARGLRQADRLHRLPVGEARRPGREPRRAALHQEHPQAMEFDKVLDDGEDARW